MRHPWSAVLSDARYALRSLRSSPGLTAIAIATLAIGGGATTAMFAVVDSVLLEPLPYPEPDEIVAVWHRAPGADLIPVNAAGDVPAAGSMLFTYAEETTVFEALGVWTPGVATVTGDGVPEEVPRVAVSAGMLEALGVPPLHGRPFGAEEQAAGASLTIMLSHGYWQRRFGGDPTVIGRTLTVNAQPAQIIGVLPRGFRIADTNADLLLPLRFDRSSLLLPPFAYSMLARLKPGATIEAANADVARMIPIWLAAWPSRLNARERAEVARIVPAVRPLLHDVVGQVGELLWLVMAAAGAVLLIACANVANLLLIRGAAREHELAIRAALGAGARRLSRGLLLEGLAVGLAGGLVGLAIAEAGLRLLTALAPANLPRLGEIGLDAGTVGVALLMLSVAGFAVGVVTSARVRGAQLLEGLHVGGRTSSEGRGQRRVRQALVVGQIALAVVVLVCAGLLIRTAGALRAVDPGFAAAEQVQTLRLSLRQSQLPEAEQVARRQQEIVEAIAALPGVSAVGFASSMPMDGLDRLEWEIEIEDRPQDPRAGRAGVRRFKNISPGFFAAIGITLVAGRDLSWSDLYDDRPVVLISENLARELWGTPAAALGKRLRQYQDDRWREVVGIVTNVREDGLRAPAPAIVYWPSLRRDQLPGAERPLPAWVSRSVVVAARSRLAGTDGFARQVQDAVWSVDRNLPLASVRTMKDIYDRSLVRTTFTLVMLVVAASAALALGVVGLYGVLSYTVTLRRREISIRLALGAQQREVRGQVVRNGVVLAAFGIGGGLLAAAGITRLMASLLYGVEPVDLPTYAAVAAALIGVAALASYVPACRASTVDPAESLAAE